MARDARPGPGPTESLRALARCRRRMRHAVALLTHTTLVLREAVADRDRALAAVRAAEAEQDAFVVAAVNELRNPLAAVKGQAQLLGRQAAEGRLDDAQLALRLARIDQGVARLAEALDALVAEVKRPLPGAEAG